MLAIDGDSKAIVSNLYGERLGRRPEEKPNRSPMIK